MSGIFSGSTGVYDAGPIQPVVKPKENLAIWTEGRWQYHMAEYIEPIPAGPATIADLVTLSAATGIAANATINKQLLAILQLNDAEMLQLRFRPLDNIECLLWELASTARFGTRSIHARVNPNTINYDPYLATTTFFVLGQQKDMNMEIRNPAAVALVMGRIQFWGYRYVLSKINPKLTGITDGENKLARGDLDTVKAAIGQVTFIPAEGRAA